MVLTGCFLSEIWDSNWMPAKNIMYNDDMIMVLIVSGIIISIFILSIPLFQ